MISAPAYHSDSDWVNAVRFNARFPGCAPGTCRWGSGMSASPQQLVCDCDKDRSCADGFICVYDIEYSPDVCRHCQWLQWSCCDVK